MIKVMLGFVVGMLFMHSLTGEYSRYGQYINNEIEDCEISAKECDYIVAPVSEVDVTLFALESLVDASPSQSRSFYERLQTSLLKATKIASKAEV